MTGKNHEVRVKLDKEEFERIEKKAKKLGLKPSQFLRLLGLSAKLPQNFLQSA